MSPDALSSLVPVLHELADQAEAVALKYFRQPLAVEDKADESPVTRADREAESAMRQLLETRFPEHGILGEEHGHAGRDREWQWILDPIDGTRAFISGLPLFGTLIALAHKEVPVLGMMALPALGERWWTALPGHAQHRIAYPQLQTQDARVSQKTRLTEAYAYSTDPAMFSPEQQARLAPVQQQVKMQRFGGDCYSYGLLASGHIDLVLEADLKPYDIAGPAAVITAAGGRVTDWNGQPVLASGWDGTVVAAASDALHQATLALLHS